MIQEKLFFKVRAVVNVERIIHVDLMRVEELVVGYMRGIIWNTNDTFKHLAFNTTVHLLVQCELRALIGVKDITELMHLKELVESSRGRIGETTVLDIYM